MVAFTGRDEMDSEVVRRPEVQLGTCPRDGGDMFRQYDENSEQWVCGQCGLITHGDPTAKGSLWEAAAA